MEDLHESLKTAWDLYNSGGLALSKALELGVASEDVCMTHNGWKEVFFLDETVYIHPRCPTMIAQITYIDDDI